MDLLHEALVLKHKSHDNIEDERQPYGPQDFDKVWGKYDAVGDLPGFAFVDELVTYYPQAQFILTDRNVDAWARAMKATGFVEVKSWSWFLRSCYGFQYARPLRRLIRIWLESFCQFEFGGGLRKAYIDYVQHCLKVVPKERLLILRYGEHSDWHDLCEFLGKKLPDTRYPVVKDEPTVLHGQSQMNVPRVGITLGKVCAFSLGAILAAASCWLLID